MAAAVTQGVVAVRTCHPGVAAVAFAPVSSEKTVFLWGPTLWAPKKMGLLNNYHDTVNGVLTYRSR